MSATKRKEWLFEPEQDLPSRNTMVGGDGEQDMERPICEKISKKFTIVGYNVLNEQIKLLVNINVTFKWRIQSSLLPSSLLSTE